MTVPKLALTPPVGADDSPLLVLGPSLGTSTILWEKTVPLLADDFRVIRWDLPGHGKSPAATASFTVEELADAVVDAVTETTAAPFFTAGVSLGGAVGLALALQHPQRSAAAVIVASGAQLGSPEAWHDRAAQARTQSVSSLIVGSAQRWFAPGSVEREPDLSGRLLHALRETDDESYALCCEALAGWDARSRLGEISLPVLALWGEHDNVAPRPKAEEIAGGVRNGRAAMIPGVAHLPPAEDPAATAAAVRAFFQEGA